jgi:predicted RNA-binding Zn-ribbon protein involved in translation (DUF1610 family)
LQFKRKIGNDCLIYYQGKKYSPWEEISMPDFISLTCPTCGAKLQITEDIERFTCRSCGNEHIIRRGGGIVSIAPVVEGLKEVKAGVDKTAAELAISRLKSEILTLKQQLDYLKLNYAKHHCLFWSLFFITFAGALLLSLICASSGGGDLSPIPLEIF